MALTDADLRKVTERTARLYEDAEARILARIAGALAAGVDAPEWAAVKLLELVTIRRDLERILDGVEEEAAGEIAAAIVDAHGLGQVTAGGPLTRIMDGGVPPQVSPAAAAIIREATVGVLGQHATILRAAADVFRAVVADAAAMQATGAITRLDAVQHALTRFAARGVAGFIDRAGRRWTMGAYTRMALRTAAHTASEVGHAEKLTDDGHDLVIVSDHKGECPECRPFEGKVLSLSGAYATSPQYRLDGPQPVFASLAEAKARGYGHPGCRHRLVAYFPGITRTPKKQGSPDDYAHRTEQRRLERGVLEWRRREAAAVTDPARRQAAARAREWSARLRAHEAAHNLKRQSYRTSVRRMGG